MIKIILYLRSRLFSNLHQLLPFLGILSVVGCSTIFIGQSGESSSIISRQQAMQIAAHELLRMKLERGIKEHPSRVYDSSEIAYSNKQMDSHMLVYNVFDNKGTAKFENVWFVMFKPKTFSLSTGLLVVVDKESGKIKYTESGNIGNGLTLSLEEKIKNHQKYITAIIDYHKANKHWPAEIHEIEPYLDNLNQELDNFIVNIKNQQEIALLDKNMFLAHIIKFKNNQYQVSLVSTGISSFDSIHGRNTIKEMFDNISK